MKYSIIFFLFISLLSNLQAKTLTSAEEMAKLADDAITMLVRSDYENALGSLIPYWPIPEAEIRNLIYQVQSQLNMVSQRFGASTGFEFIKESRVGTSFYRRIYIQKFQNHAVRWIFVFYKPKDLWVVNSVSYDDQIDQLFE